MAALAKVDDDTFVPCLRAQKLARGIGKFLALTSRELDCLCLGALLHDIGKQDIPCEVLNKEDPLLPAEWDLIEQHPRRGWEYIQATELNDVVKEIILKHHIWFNGKGGYPCAETYGKPCF
ncbi:MAG: HD domain-containing protein [Firmicutes bacterium]|nr:HD domain-containing protein [Bacillota bacterium]